MAATARGLQAPRPTSASGQSFAARWRTVPPLIGLSAAAVALLAALPLLYLVLRSLDAGAAALDLLASPRTLDILFRSLALTAAVAAVAVMLGLPLAWLTTRTDLPLRRLWLTLTVLPLVVPTYVGGLVVILALGPRGMLQQALAPFGVDRLPEIYGFPGALLILSLHTYPYVLLTVRAALQRLDPAVEEAARSLGLTPWQTFRRVVLPQLRPAIVAGALPAALYALGDFGSVSLMRYETFTWAIYIQYQSAFDRSIAATLSLVLVAVAAAILLVEARTRGPERQYRSVPGTLRPPSRMPLRAWRWPALALCAAPVVVAVLLPVVVLATWAARAAFVASDWLRILGQAAVNSLWVSALAALVAVVACLPLAVMSVRYPGRFSALLERTAYVGFALPRIAIALGLVFFGVNYVRPLYQTSTLLVIAYAILFLPVALGSVRTSLRQVNPHLEEAARSLGRRPARVFLEVTLPIVQPGIMAGAALVFLLGMEELPATLMLRPTGMDTLATAVWSAASEALFAQAAIPALLLIAASTLSFALTYARGGR